jgi:hypothetical protein
MEPSKCKNTYLLVMGIISSLLKFYVKFDQRFHPDKTKPVSLSGATTFRIVTLSIMTLSTMNLSMKNLLATLSINDIKRK